MRAALTLLALITTACNTRNVPMTQLQIRELQTRTYDLGDTQRAIKAVLNVLIDEDFVPKEVNDDIGYIYALKEVDVENSQERFWAKFKHRDPRWNKFLQVECAANISALRDGVRVRLSFHAKTLDNHGQVVAVEPIRDPAFYQSLFSRVDKGMYLEKEGL
jgi:hypothetical protein